MAPRTAQIVRTSLLLLGALGAGWLGSRLGGGGTTPAPSVQGETAAPTEQGKPRDIGPSVAPVGLATGRRTVVTREVSVAPSQAELLEGTRSPEERVRRARALLRSLDSLDRTEGLNLLHEEDPAQAIDVARALLHDRDVDLASPAARVLAMNKVMGAEDYEALGSIMRDGSLSPEARTAATGALMSSQRMADSSDIGRWFDAALESDVGWVRGSAVANVAQLPTEQAVPLLAKALKDADPQVAKGALMALVHGHGGEESLGTDPAAWQAWLVERKAAAEKKAADDYAMQNPKIERPAEAAQPTDEFAPTPDPPEVLDAPTQE